jgi:hypothetical protein
VSGQSADSVGGQGHRSAAGVSTQHLPEKLTVSVSRKACSEVALMTQEHSAWFPYLSF